MQININTTKLDAIAKLFDEMGDRTTDLSPIGRDLADIMRDDLRKRFASAPATEIGGEVYGGVTWSRLTDASFFINPARRGRNIGIDTGSLQRQVTIDGSGNLYTVNGSNFSFELTSEKAQSFQEKRPLVFWYLELLRRVNDRIIEFVIRNQ